MELSSKELIMAVGSPSASTRKAPINPMVFVEESIKVDGFGKACSLMDHSMGMEEGSGAAEFIPACGRMVPSKIESTRCL